MKKILMVMVLGIFVMAGFFCFALYQFANNTDINITVNDSDDIYRVEASYDEDQSKRILSYVDAELNNTKRFRNTHLDEDVDLDINTHFHINTEPGYLEITVDKDENNPETIEKFKRITQGIKVRLTTGENE
jgi:hypothetical protein